MEENNLNERPEDGLPNVRADKAYNNREFIHSMDGRTIRLLSEYLYPEQYFRKHGIKNTIVFFGSARTLPLKEHAEKLEQLNAKLAGAVGDDISKIEEEILWHKKMQAMSKIYEEAVVLSEMVAEWSETITDEKKKYFVCTGGGPGMMEAANRGAYNVGAPNIGLNISLPFEQCPNAFISEELNFEFHYFFMRKFWFVYLSKAVIALPGGFGTLDELFEILTLKQTTKVTRPLPIVLYSEEFWKNLINFDYLIETKMINKEDMNLFKFCNTPQEAFDFITSELTRIHNLEFKK